MTKKFSVPYNGDIKNFPSLINKYKDYIYEIYAPIDPETLGSGRGLDTSSPFYTPLLEKIIQIAHSKDIKFNLLLNSTSMWAVLADTQRYLKLLQTLEYYIYGLRVDSITITNPVLAKKIINESGIPICASVNMYIDCFDKADYAKDLGITCVCVERDRNRDLDFIASLKEDYKFQVKVIVNEGCLPHCLLRNTHFDFLSILSNNSLDRKNDYDEEIRKAGCGNYYLKDHSLFIRSPFIRPEDLDYYDVDIYKIAGRTHPTEHIDKYLQAYTQKKWNGALEELIDNPWFTTTLWQINCSLDNRKFPSDFFTTISNCNSNCNQCHYCEEVFQMVATYHPSGGK